MKLIYNPHTDPYFNLASEEYLIDNVPGDIFMLWRNEPSVIIGRNQNAYTELDSAFAAEHNIKAVRRLTGGGAVFHDLGNVNYTFITEYNGAGTLDFEKFCRPVIEAINKLGVSAALSGRNDILADGKKISGNAQCVRGGRVLHHGTLLWSADFSDMAGVLRPDPSKLEGKGIKSVRSRVGNLRDMLPDGRIPEEYRVGDGRGASDFIAYLFSCFDGAYSGFSDAETAEIRRLSDEKYSTWEWNYGAAGSFSANVRKRFPYGAVELSYEAEKGRLTDIRISGDFFGVKPAAELAARLKNESPRLCRDDMTAVFSDVGEYITGASPEEISALICGI